MQIQIIKDINVLEFKKTSINILKGGDLLMEKFNTNYDGKIYLNYIPNENKMVEFIVNNERVMNLCVEFQFQRIAEKIIRELPSPLRTDEDFEQGIEVLKKYVVFSEGGW